MRCPVHVAVEMEIVVADRPHFQVAGGDDEDRRASRLRRFWRCTVQGCRQVSQIVGDAFEPERIVCSKCGAPADPEVHATYQLLRCKKCYDETNREKSRQQSARNAQKRREASRRGGLAGGGHNRGIARISIRKIA